MTTPEEACEELLAVIGADMSDGQLALEAVILYRATGLPVPDWALDEIESAYHDFKHGAPLSGWTRQAKITPAPRSLGEAFGVEDVKGEHMRTRRLRAMMTPVLVHLFSTKKYPRSEEGFAAAAEALGLSPKQVRTWLKEQ